MADINENRAGYKKTKVGWIPEEWKAVLLGKNTKVFSGGTPKSTEKTFYGGDIPWIRSTEVNQGEIHSTEKTLTTLGLENSSAKLVKPGTLLMALYGATAGVIGVSKLQAAINQAVLAVLPKNNLRSDFLKFYLKWYSPKMVHRFTQGGQPNLSATIFKRQGIPLPPLPEQKKIAAILSTWDAAIRKLDQLIERKQTLKKGLMQQLLTGQRRFPEFVPSGGTRYRDTKLGKVPEDWEVVKLGKVGKVQGGNAFKSRNYSDHGVPLIRISNIQNGQVQPDEIKIPKDQKWDKFLLQKEDILIAMSGATTGKIGIYNHSSPAYLNQRVGRFIPDRNQMNQGFLRYIVSTRKFAFNVLIDAIGGAQPNISNKDIQRIEVAVPPLHEQNKIAEALLFCDKEIKSLELKKRKLEIQKKGLMQQLLTGAVRVKT